MVGPRETRDGTVMGPGGNGVEYFGATLRGCTVDVLGSLSWGLTTEAGCPSYYSHTGISVL